MKIYKNNLKILYKIYAKNCKKGLDKPMKLLYNSTDRKTDRQTDRQTGYNSVLFSVKYDKLSVLIG